MRVYTPEALPRLLASFQTLDATLARAWAQIASPAATAAERVQQLISQRQILDEEDRRPGASLPSPAIVVNGGGGGAKGASAPSSWSAPVSYARASACFVDASRCYATMTRGDVSRRHHWRASAILHLIT